jgi:hypothetical protein
MADRKPARREVRKPPAFTLSTGWAAALLALLVVLFFHELTLGGKTFVSPDATAPAGFVRVGEQALYRDHYYPLWNPSIFLGMPSFASGAYNPLIYPPDWPLALLQKVMPFLPDMTWMLLYYFLGGLSLFLLAREWGARPEGALIGAAAFVFAPNLVAVGSHGHGSQLVDSAYLPLMLWLATRWMRRGGLQHVGWLALAGGFQMLRGHVQICFYTWIAVALYAAFEWLSAARRPADLGRLAARALAIGAAAALAFGIAGFYNLPLRDYARYSIRGGGEGGGVGMEYATQWSLAPVELPSLVVPGWVGFGGETYWGAMPFTDYPNVYLGMVAVLLAIPACLARPAASAPRLFAFGLATLALLISFGRHFPLYGFLYAHLPLFNKFRVPVMVVLLVQIGAALGTAWGASLLLEGPGEKPRRPSALDRYLPAAAIALALAIVVVFAAQDAWRGRYVAFALGQRRPYSPELAGIAWQGFASDLARVGALGLLALGAAWLRRRGRISVTSAGIAFLVLLLVELWPVSGRVMKPVIGETPPRGLDRGRDDIVEFLERAGPAGSFRILPLEEYQSNRFAGFGIASVGGAHAAKPRLFQDFYEAGLVSDPAWLRLLNVRYIVSYRAIDPLPPMLRQVHQGSGFVYENLAALPRATVVGAWRIVQPAKAILDSVKAGTHDAAGFTFLERDPGIPPADASGARASIVSYRLNDLAVDVDTPAPALLRLADLWYPDWTATVDGRRVEVLKADYLLRAVAVPAGRHRVVFRFESAVVRRGLAVSLVSLVVAVALLAVPGLIRRRPRGPAAPAVEVA